MQRYRPDEVESFQATVQREQALDGAGGATLQAERVRVYWSVQLDAARVGIDLLPLLVGQGDTPGQARERRVDACRGLARRGLGAELERGAGEGDVLGHPDPERVGLSGERRGEAGTEGGIHEEHLVPAAMQPSLKTFAERARLDGDIRTVEHRRAGHPPPG